MKSWAREFALGLLLAAAIPQAAAVAAQSAEQILLDKANYWRLKDRPDLAIDALQQLLSINPNQPDALYQYGVIEVQRGNIDSAKGYLARLQRAAPSSARIADLENAIRAGQVSPSELSEARRLAQSGQFSQAAEKYQQTFKGPPPPTFGVEYYQTLAGTPQRWAEARSGLESLVEKSPNDSKAKLALADVLTYHAETRARGIRMLAQLADDSVVGAQAVRSWKQAMMWLGAGPEDRQLYNQYFAKFPNDAEVKAHLAEVGKPGAPAPGARGPGAGRRTGGGRGPSAETGPPVSPARGRSDAVRSQGQALEARGDAAGAAAKYQEAIAVDPSNPWARLDFARLLARQGNAAQAFQIVDPAASGGTPDSYHAAALFYSEQNRIPDALRLLDSVAAGSRSRAIVETRERLYVMAEIERAKQLARSNRIAARNVLVQLASRPPQTADKARLIADALADIGDPQEALQLAHGAAARGDARGVVEYARLLVRAGRDAEAVAYLTQAENSRAMSAEGRRELEKLKIDIAVKRADALRTRGDIAAAYDQISALLAAYPNDPNLLLAAGRIYASAGQNAIAMRFVDAAFRQAPGDLGVIRGAIGGAIIAGDLERAQAYLAVGLQQFPNNARLFYMAAEIDRAAGDNASALYHLDAARRLDPTRQAGAFETVPLGVQPVQPGPAGAGGLPPNPFRRAESDGARPPVRLASATPIVSATDAVSVPPTQAPAVSGGSVAPAPLLEHAESADSEDLVTPPRAGERPPRRVVAKPIPASSGEARLLPRPQLASVGYANDAGLGSGSDAVPPPRFGRSTPPQLAQLPPPPPPVPTYPAQTYTPAAYGAPPAYGAPAYNAAAYPPPPPPTYAAPPAPAYGAAASSGPAYSSAPAAALQPLPPPPIPGYQAPLYAVQPTPAPQDSLELDIERSMAAIAAESGPALQGGVAFRARGGEEGLSRLTEIGAPIETTFSPFYTGTMRLQAIPTYITAGTVDTNALLRFGQIPLLGLTPGATLAGVPSPGSQNAGGVALNVAYSYQMFSGEIGTTPLGFPVENLIGRVALTWPGPSDVSTAFPRIPLAPLNVTRPFQVKVEGARQPITESLLSYAGTKDPVSGLVWGGVVKTGGGFLASYDDGDVGVYGGAGFWSIDGKSVASNSEVEGLVGAYIRPYRVGETSLKVGVNLSFMGFDKNLRFFTFGQGGYFSPQHYLNFSVPVEYSGRNGRFTYLVGGALGVQTYGEDRSPYFPRDPSKQSSLQAAFGNAAFYPSRDVTGLSFGARGQLEYQLDNGFSVGGLASIDNAQNYTEGIAKLYLRKSFGATPTAAFLPKPLPGSL